MAKTVLFQYGDDEAAVSLGAAIKRDELYGKQSRSVEKDGEPLEKVILDPEGALFLPSHFCHLQVDADGSVDDDPITETPDGEVLPTRVSSFKEKRDIRPAQIEDLARLRVTAIMPATCDSLPAGIYSTKFTYRDAPVLKDAILNITSDAAFLLVGTSIESPFQGTADVYNFFDGDGADDTEDDGDTEAEDLSFAMFD